LRRFGKDCAVLLSRPAAIAVLVASLVLPASALAACGRGECSAGATAPAGHDTSFVGRASARRDHAVDFVVESVATTGGHTPDAHTPAVGATVTVLYSGDTAGFVHAGRDYRVVVAWENGRYRSWIHEAGDCDGSSGTTHVDGSAIDTADFPWLHNAVLLFALAPVVALAVLSAVLWNQRRRARRRTNVVTNG
jgi:hypothetical protein